MLDKIKIKDVKVLFLKDKTCAITGEGFQTARKSVEEIAKDFSDLMDGEIPQSLKTAVNILQKDIVDWVAVIEIITVGLTPSATPRYTEFMEELFKLRRKIQCGGNILPWEKL